MSNLGRYQDIVISAKRAGGVDAYLAAVSAEAVARSRPLHLGLGFGAGLAVAAATAGLVVAYHRQAGRQAPPDLPDEQVTTNNDSPTG